MQTSFLLKANEGEDQDCQKSIWTPVFLRREGTLENDCPSNRTATVVTKAKADWEERGSE